MAFELKSIYKPLILTSWDILLHVELIQPTFNRRLSPLCKSLSLGYPNGRHCSKLVKHCDFFFDARKSSQVNLGLAAKKSGFLAD